MPSATYLLTTGTSAGGMSLQRVPGWSETFCNLYGVPLAVQLQWSCCASKGDALHLLMVI